MKPRIVMEWATRVTMAMPIPKHIPKDFFSVSEWRKCYENDDVAEKVLDLADAYNVYIMDIHIESCQKEFHFEMCLQSAEIAKKFKNEISLLLG